MADTDDALVTRLSPWSVSETVVRLRAVIAACGMDVVAVIDSGAIARGAGWALQEAVLIVWGDSEMTVPIITVAPLSAFDLPPRVLVWADTLETKVTYLVPGALVARYGIAIELAATLARVADIVDVAIDR